MYSKTQKEPRPETLMGKSSGGVVSDAILTISSPKSDWRKRLLSLDADKQKQIALKYYGGHMPWKD